MNKQKTIVLKVSDVFNIGGYEDNLFLVHNRDNIQN